MNTLMKGNSPLGMIYNQSAENIAYDSNNSVKDMIDTLSDKRSLTMTPGQGVTNNSTAKVVGNLILLSIDVTYSSAGSGWASAFDIPNVSETVVGTFSVVTDTDGTEIKSLQAYYDNNTIIVRIRNPLAKQYRGEAILSFS